MLTEEDFELESLTEINATISQECTLIRDVEKQRELAKMCIAKAKLCLCISHVLSAQYSVLVKYQGQQSQEGSTRSSVMLFPKKLDQTYEVKRCDVELSEWVTDLPDCCVYSNEMDQDNSGASLFVQRSLLHMVYYTTLSALHRPQVLPSAETTQPNKYRELQDLSRKKVREASREITRISQDLHTRGLEKYLPTTGVTVLLPAIIIHLLDIKSCNDDARKAATDGFCQCMLVLEKLRDNYAAADYATQFLEAAIRKADIDVVMGSNEGKISYIDVQATLSSDKVRELRERSRAARRTPPFTNGELNGSISSGMMMDGQNSMHHMHNAISVRTPPETQEAHLNQMNDTTMDTCINGGEMNMIMDNNFDLNDFLNFDGPGAEMGYKWNTPLEEGAHGESGGFLGDMGWIEQGGQQWSAFNSPQPHPGQEEEGIFTMLDQGEVIQSID
jgi:hypothetical protein